MTLSGDRTFLSFYHGGSAMTDLGLSVRRDPARKEPERPWSDPLRERTWTWYGRLKSERVVQRRGNETRVLEVRK